jgi:glycerol kinase
MPYILALDQGTTSSRAILFDEGGEVAAAAQEEFRQIFPEPGWVEHDPEEIWSSQLGVARRVLVEAGAAAKDVSGIGITNQRETTLLWNRATGRPVHNAVVWQDRRTAGQCALLKNRGIEDVVREKTGLLIDPYFSAPKIRWILDNVPGAAETARAGGLAFGTVDTWLLWKLTGGRLHATDATNASRTLLFDIRTGDWDEDLLAIFDVPREILPEIRPSSEVYGTTAPGIFDRPIPIAGIAGDQQAALFGQVCFDPGMAKNTYGTGCFLLMHAGRAPVVPEQRLLSTVAWRIGDETEYALEGSVFIAGAAVQWLRDGLGILDSAPEVERLASGVADSGGVVFVPALAGLGAPHWNPRARGTILGITRGTERGHVARAALEGIAHQVADVAEAMAGEAAVTLDELRVDGGAATNDLLMQIQADLLRVPVKRPRVCETTALGAAYLAGLATGFWKSRDDVASHWRLDRAFLPSADPRRVRAERARWREAIERSKDWA